MLKFCANLNFLYGGNPTEERLAAAARDGFAAVEFVSPYEREPEEVAQMLRRHSLQTALFNISYGNPEAKEMGLMILADRERDFQDSVDQAQCYAVALGCMRINVAVGVNTIAEKDDILFARLVERLSFAADKFAPHGITAMLENLNPTDVPGCWVNTPSRALEIVKKVNRKNVRLQYDLYHAQRTAGNLVEFMRNNIEWIGHVQVADNPGRHQPDTGEMNYAFILAELEKSGYDGWIGLEYKPVPDTAGSFRWMMAYSRK